ncbi:endonuclease/exonuclease/phosphatase family protein [Desulfosporosinus fructosivorans]|uniref:endonuclease/exonuclease/phosphatase family protein n=1 Tax=Desulfosporosinus fructosivorans TaxID=2018669 RepID=UPI001FB158E7|nr:endonuclease/exonuclease/phosphatase family protein [Desulfosporosinus fructosivorans]
MLRSSRNVLLSIMTWNIYIGAELTPLLRAIHQQIPRLVTKVFYQFLATDFSKRAKAIAHQIILKKPDIIGLQEAALWELNSPYSQRLVYDFVHILLCELKCRGLVYKVVAQNKNSEATLPSSLWNVIRLTDRDVILVRETSQVKVIRKVETNFKTNLQVKIAGQPFTILRGWSAIDALVQGCRFRLVNTHLDSASPEVQISQANELLSGPAATKIPLIFTGDFNSNANGSGTPTYRNLIAAGFEDTWIAADKSYGFTCCQDADLLNVKSQLNERVDLILFKNNMDWTAVEAEVVGETPRDRTTKLWPSDHAGVYVKLKLKDC